jgi:hypothetical protein
MRQFTPECVLSDIRKIFFLTYAFVKLSKHKDGGSDNSTVFLTFHLIAASNKQINVTRRLIFFFGDVYRPNADFVNHSFIYTSIIRFHHFYKPRKPLGRVEV